MRRLTHAVVVAAFLTISAGGAGAAEIGSIEGRIVNETTGRPQRGVEVTLSGVAEVAAGRAQRTVTTGADGRYSFGRLETGNEWRYVVDATYAGGLFPGRVVTLPEETARRPVLDTTLRVWDTTADPAAILVVRDSMFVVPGDESGVGVLESITVVNQTDLAYVGRGDRADADGSRASLGFALPEGARRDFVRIEESTVDVPEVVATDFGFGITTAIPPGRTRITYSYRVSGASGTYELGRTALYPTARYDAFAEAPIEIASNRLRPADEEVELEGTTYRRWSAADGFDAGDTIQLQAVTRAAVPWGLFAVAAGAGLLLLGVSAWAIRRRSHADADGARARAPEKEEPQTRSELIASIASLDLDYRAGRLSKQAWEQRRADLKDRLQKNAASVG